MFDFPVVKILSIMSCNLQQDFSKSNFALFIHHEYQRDRVEFN